MDTKKIGNTIREARKSSGLSIKQLANLVGVSEQAISQYELGKRAVSIEALQKISDALDISVLELLDPEEVVSAAFSRPYSEIEEGHNRAHAISEYVLNNPKISRNSAVGEVINNSEFQMFITALLWHMLKTDAHKRDTLILLLSEILEIDQKYKFTQRQIEDFQFAISFMVSSISTTDPEVFEHTTSVIKKTLEKIGQDLKKNPKEEISGSSQENGEAT